MKLMAHNENAENKVAQEIGETIFSNAENFVKSYNSGIINVRNEVINSYAQLINDSYKNLELKNYHFDVISETEVSLKELKNIIDQWNILVKLKRKIAENSKNIGEQRSVNFYLEGKYSGLILLENGEEYDSLDEEKIFIKTEAPIFVKAIENNLSSESYASDGSMIQIDLEAIRNLDESFISRLYNSI